MIMLVASYEMHPKMQARLTLAAELHKLHFKITSHICARWYYLYYYSCLCSRSLLPAPCACSCSPPACGPAPCSCYLPAHHGSGSLAFLYHVVTNTCAQHRHSLTFVIRHSHNAQGPPKGSDVVCELCKLSTCAYIPRMQQHAFEAWRNMPST